MIAFRAHFQPSSLSSPRSDLVHWIYNVCANLVLVSTPHILTITISGPMIGGNLSNAGTKWPEFGAKYPIFRQYVSSHFVSAISYQQRLKLPSSAHHSCQPYLLPCIISSSISVIAIILCSLFVKEVRTHQLDQLFSADHASSDSSEQDSKQAIDR